MHIIFKCQTVCFSLLSTGFVGQQGPSLWVIFMAVACIIALVLPLEGVEYSGSLPHYLLLSVNQKLLAAFILGRHDCFVLLFYFNFLTQRSHNFVFSLITRKPYLRALSITLLSIFLPFCFTYIDKKK